MKKVVFALLCVAVAALSVPVTAGPLTGAPTIKFETGGPIGEPAGPSYGFGIAYSNFGIELRDATTGAKDSFDFSGPLFSGEVSWPLGEEQTKSLSLGGWFATTEGDDIEVQGGEIHGRYNWNPNWGFELALPYGDFGDLFGLAYHLTYQLKPKTMPALSAQFGLGGASDSNDFGGAKFKTDFSFYSNLSYKVSENWNATLGLWLLSQKLDYNGAWPQDDMTTVQWSLGASYSY